MSAKAPSHLQTSPGTGTTSPPPPPDAQWHPQPRVTRRPPTISHQDSRTPCFAPRPRQRRPSGRLTRPQSCPKQWPPLAVGIRSLARRHLRRRELGVPHLLGGDGTAVPLL